MERVRSAAGRDYLERVRREARDLPYDYAHELLLGIEEHIDEIELTSEGEGETAERIADLTPPERVVADARGVVPEQAPRRPRPRYIRPLVRWSAGLFLLTFAIALVPFLWWLALVPWAAGVLMSLRARMWMRRIDILWTLVPALAPALAFGLLFWAFDVGSIDCRDLADGTRMCTEPWREPDWMWPTAAISFVAGYLASVIRWFVVAGRGEAARVGPGLVETTVSVARERSGTSLAIALSWLSMIAPVVLTIRSWDSSYQRGDGVLVELFFLPIAIGWPLLGIAATRVVQGWDAARGGVVGRLAAAVAVVAAAATCLAIVLVPLGVSADSVIPEGCSLVNTRVRCDGKFWDVPAFPSWYLPVIYSALLLVAAATYVVRRDKRGRKETV